jgi:hypothetical protein
MADQVVAAVWRKKPRPSFPRWLSSKMSPEDLLSHPPHHQVVCSRELRRFALVKSSLSLPRSFAAAVASVVMTIDIINKPPSLRVHNHRECLI